MGSSFLPQDKVAEFAKMAPDVVLRETMRAAGDPRLIQWHDTLIEKGKVLIDLEEVRMLNCAMVLLKVASIGKSREREAERDGPTTGRSDGTRCSERPQPPRPGV